MIQKKITALNTSKEFQYVFNNGTQIKNSYFVLYYCKDNLSTEIKSSSVDISSPNEVKLGLVVPKRLAKHAVTRSMIKRQGRSLFSSQVCDFPPTHFVIRLKKPISRLEWKSCTSLQLKNFIRLQLQDLFQKANTHFSEHDSLKLRVC